MQAPTAEHVFETPRVAATLLGRTVQREPTASHCITAVPCLSIARSSATQSTGTTHADWEQEQREKQEAAGRYTVHLSVQHACARAGQKLYIVGGSRSMGNWDVSKGIAFDDARYPLWTTTLAIAAHELPCEYKFFLSSGEGSEVVWEAGTNRVLHGPEYTRLCRISSPVRLICALRQADSGAATRHDQHPQLLKEATQEVMATRGNDPFTTIPAVDAVSMEMYLSHVRAKGETWVRVPSAEAMQQVRDELAEVELQARAAAARARREEQERAAAAILRKHAASLLASERKNGEPRAAEAPAPVASRSEGTQLSFDSGVDATVEVTPGMQVAVLPAAEGQAFLPTLVPHRRPILTAESLQLATTTAATSHTIGATTGQQAPSPAEVDSDRQAPAPVVASGAALAWNENEDEDVEAAVALPGAPAAVTSRAQLDGQPQLEDTPSRTLPVEQVKPAISLGVDTLVCVSLHGLRLFPWHSAGGPVGSAHAGSSAWRGMGVSVPLQALRSHRDHGIGDFGDLRAFVSWAASAGIHVVHLPPVTDTHGSGHDRESSPYRSTSAFALHPAYINLLDVAEEIQAQHDTCSGMASRQGSAETYHAGVHGHGPNTANTAAAGIYTASSSSQEQGSLHVHVASAQALGSGQSVHSPTALPAKLVARILAEQEALLHPTGAMTGGAGSSQITGGALAANLGPNRSHMTLSYNGLHVPSSVHAPGTPGKASSSGQAFRGGAFDARAAASRPQLDYRRAFSSKMVLLREIFRAIGAEQALTARGSSWSQEFADFYASNADWLQPYAGYCIIRDLLGSHAPADWGSRANITHEAIQSMTDPSSLHYRAVAFVYWLQWIAHKQLQSVVNRAEQVGVLLFTEIPAGIPSSSADAWHRPHLVKTRSLLASPPNLRLRDGAAWCVSPFAWPGHTADKFSWWRRRINRLSTYFSGVLLNHVDTYFKTFEIPSTSTTGLGGVWVPALGSTLLELRASGLWDQRRLTAPYVREWGARAALGPDFAALAGRFFTIREGVYSFRESVASEEAILRAVEGSPYAHVAPALIALLNNVCLLETQDEEGASTFQPRADVMGTTSFLELEESGQAAIRRAQQVFVERQRPLWLGTGVGRLAGLAGQGTSLAGLNPTVALMADDIGCSVEICDAIGRLGFLPVRTHRVPLPSHTPDTHPQHMTSALEPIVAGHGQPFSNPAVAYPYGCVSTPGLLDQSSLREWWESDAVLASHFYHETLGSTPPLPPTAGQGQGTAAAAQAPLPLTTGSSSFVTSQTGGPAMGMPGAELRTSISLPRQCTPDIASALIKLHMNSPAMITMVTLPDLLGMDPALRHPDPPSERVSVRSAEVRGQHVWTYRCHVLIEELQQAHAFNAKVKEMVIQAGRQLPVKAAGK